MVFLLSDSACKAVWKNMTGGTLVKKEDEIQQGPRPCFFLCHNHELGQPLVSIAPKDLCAGCSLVAQKPFLPFLLIPNSGISFSRKSSQISDRTTWLFLVFLRTYIYLIFTLRHSLEQMSHLTDFVRCSTYIHLQGIHSDTYMTHYWQPSGGTLLSSCG